MNSNEGWSEFPVSEIADVILGGTPKRSEPKFWNGNIKWATANDVANCPVKYIRETQEKITELGLRKSNAKLLPQGTIVITARGTVGEIRVLGEPMAFNQTCYGLIPKNKSTDSDFLYYALKNAINKMKALSYGTVFETITTRTFDELTILIPPLPEQKKIAEILSSLDDKIELNYEMNKTLEAIAQAIFKHWFIDFGPFKDQLVYNEELGKEIPEGWEVVKLGEICKINMGQSPPSITYNKDRKGLPFFQGIKEFGFRYPNPSVYCSAPRKIAEPGDILFSVRAPIGELNVALERSCIGRGIAALRYKFGSNNFLFYLFKSTQKYWKRVYEGRGTVFGCVTKEHLNNFELVFPGKDIVNKFNSIVEPFDEMIKKNEEESIILAQIRDTLLPKLLSGEIRVKADIEEEFPKETKKLVEIKKEKARIRKTLLDYFEGA